MQITVAEPDSAEQCKAVIATCAIDKKTTIKRCRLFKNANTFSKAELESCMVTSLSPASHPRRSSEQRLTSFRVASCGNGLSHGFVFLWSLFGPSAVFRVAVICHNSLAAVGFEPTRGLHPRG